jgi:hypothetical protein
LGENQAPLDLHSFTPPCFNQHHFFARLLSHSLISLAVASQTITSERASAVGFEQGRRAVNCCLLLLLRAVNDCTLQIEERDNQRLDSLAL